jgi:hypothetical protein
MQATTMKPTSANQHTELSEQACDLAGFGTDLIDLSEEFLADLRITAGSPLAHAIRRVAEERETGTDVSAGFNNSLR